MTQEKEEKNPGERESCLHNYLYGMSLDLSEYK